MTETCNVNDSPTQQCALGFMRNGEVTSRHFRDITTKSGSYISLIISPPLVHTAVKALKAFDGAPPSFNLIHYHITAT